MSESRVRILSVDGGGIRGVIPATVLVDLERRAQRPAADVLDLYLREGPRIFSRSLWRRIESVVDRRREVLKRRAARGPGHLPTYFEPVHVRSATGTQSALIDGGVFAVNPASL
jgi:patatin-like phospholipase/acyl hydrolase